MSVENEERGYDVGMIDALTITSVVADHVVGMGHDRGRLWDTGAMLDVVGGIEGSRPRDVRLTKNFVPMHTPSSYSVQPECVRRRRSDDGHEAFRGLRVPGGGEARVQGLAVRYRERFEL